MRDEALYLFQEHDERNRTIRVRGADVDEEGYRCHGLRVYPVCVCNTVRLGQVMSRHNLKPSGTRFECVSGLSV